ncbi:MULTISPECIES: hypothetical protein [Methylobacterium]|uniref:Uncharacterized protein n=1 Tax=Methylobacterium longum TaxID=767694 RepID=A0ABT8AI55_9HYPH|nr:MULTISPECIES: hypothetical protein [Methylobacterium]MCJ2100085.1 hypothetical protein [Methylobacterium sp. E-046]MDN3569397.1 hypothetical protein [Methylobacterium longum]GJE12307.1 hypothetical protein FOHLNKBM_3354 [Methylobacterium longum]
MSDTEARVPGDASRLIFATTAMFAATIGMITQDWGFFFLAMLGSAVLQCAIYMPIQRWLGWKPLDLGHLGHLALLLLVP